MLDRYTTGPRKPSIYKVDNGLGADQRGLFAHHEALDHLGNARLADAAGHVFGHLLERRRRVTHSDPEPSPGNHVLIVEVVTDGADTGLRNAQAVGNHRQCLRLWHLRIYDFDEPI